MVKLVHMKISNDVYYGITKFEGKNSAMHGDTSGLHGDCTWLDGDCTGVVGDCTGLHGDCTGVFGDLNAAALVDREALIHCRLAEYVTEVEVNG
jgi:hypothetical protein